jgi:uncharacterized iron-regulated protein
MGRIGAVAMAVLLAGTAGAEVPAGMEAANVVFLGEVHDNPASHARQAELVGAVRPRALVFEMLTEAQVEKITPELRRDGTALGLALGWDEAGWPDFAMYYPIFAAAPEAGIYAAAVPREAARAAMQAGMAESFGAEAAAYGLDAALPEAQQDAREAMQFEAHCEALPEEMLPVMVDLQRLRDAVLARAVKRALDETGGPVAVIAGNGHARKDWGAPAALGRVSDVPVFALGIVEPGGEEGAFDAVETVPAVEREDPCEVFRKG